jgi:hypothetical protein
MFDINRLNHVLGRLASLKQRPDNGMLTDGDFSDLVEIAEEAKDIIGGLIEDRTRLNNEHANITAERDMARVRCNSLGKALETSLETSISLLNGLAVRP